MKMPKAKTDNTKVKAPVILKVSPPAKVVEKAAKPVAKKPPVVAKPAAKPAAKPVKAPVVVLAQPDEIVVGRFYELIDGAIPRLVGELVADNGKGGTIRIWHAGSPSSTLMDVTYAKFAIREISREVCFELSASA